MRIETDSSGNVVEIEGLGTCGVFRCARDRDGKPVNAPRIVEVNGHMGLEFRNIDYAEEQDE